ncbi:MAG: glycosyltransferase family 2 protein [Anaerolineae bacterium]
MSPEKSPRVSVIIPNWNGAHLLPACLDSLTRQTYPNFETLVVDNASTDSSRELLARDYAPVRVVALDSNRMFAGGVNAGIRAAEGEILVLLNNDTEAEPTWLEELVRALLANPRAGMAASKLRVFAERNKLHTAGDFYRVDGIPGNRGVWEEDRGQYDDPTTPPPVFGACGGAAAYRRELFDRVGSFDEELWFNCEDVDLNWRARLAGYACVFAPRSIVYHMVSATGGGVRSSFFAGRNFILVLAKNYPASLWKKYWRRILAAQFRITWDALKAWRGEAARARLRGQLAGLASLPHFLGKRQAIQAMRGVSDEELERVLAH